jgi:lipopolysaccharide export system protein LptC
MLTYDNRYSYFVFIAKIFLPISALIILSTLFLLARFSDSSQIVAISEIGTDRETGSQKITAPIYSGLTDDGSILEFSSGSLAPSILSPKKVFAKKVLAKITTSKGIVYEISSDKGSYNDNTSTVDLKTNVVVVMPEGYKIYTENLSTHVKKTMLHSPSPILAEGLIGTLNAGNMSLIEKNNQHLLIFKKGVKLNTTISN